MASVLDQYIAMAAESTYGAFPRNRGDTADVPPTTCYEADSDAWAANAEMLDYRGFRAQAQTTQTVRQRRQPRGGTGRINAPLLHDGDQLRLAHLLGAFTGAANVAGTSGATRAAARTARSTDDGPSGSYTVQTVLTDRSGAQHVLTFLGCVPTDFSLNADTNSPLMLDIGYYATDVDLAKGRAADADLVFSEAPMYTWADVSISVAGASTDWITGFAFDAALGFDTDRYALRGDADPKRPRRASTPRFGGTLTGELAGLADLGRDLAGTRFAVVLTARGPTAISTATNPDTYPEAKLTLPSCIYTGGSATGAADALTGAEFPFEAAWDGAAAAVELEITYPDPA